MAPRDDEPTTRVPAWKHYLAALKHRLGHVELPVLLLTVLVLGGVWVFVEVADAVVEGETHRIDEAILLSMRSADDRSDPVGPLWLEELGRDFTALGGVGVLTLLTFAVIGYLLIRQRRRAALLVLVAVGGGFLLSMLLKEGFDRPRPDLVPHESHVYTASFPSGHSMMAAATYLALGALLARIHRRRRVKTYFLSLAVLLTVAVGVSRVYMGVHWPTDVLAGWAAGAVWALVCWLAALWLQQRGSVEHSVDGPEAMPADAA